MTEGMNMGILALLLFVGLVLGGIGAFIGYLVKRSGMSLINGPEDLGIPRINEVRSTHND